METKCWPLVSEIVIENFNKSRHFSIWPCANENAPNVHFREAKFQNFLGEHALGPP